MEIQGILNVLFEKTRHEIHTFNGALTATFCFSVEENFVGMGFFGKAIAVFFHIQSEWK